MSAEEEENADRDTWHSPESLIPFRETDQAKELLVERNYEQILQERWTFDSLARFNGGKFR